VAQHCALPILTPCHLIYGGSDELVTPRPARFLAATFPSSDVVLLTHARHQLNVLHPAAVAATVEGYAARHGAPPPPPPRSIGALALALLWHSCALVDSLVGVTAAHTPLAAAEVASPLLRSQQRVAFAPSFRRKRSVGGLRTTVE
jgi:hypothetical protein